MDAAPVKHWTFNTLAIAGFSSSGLAVTLLVINALGANRFVAILLPVAIVLLVIGGIMSVRAHLLWFRGRSNTLR
ncbi:MAG TPA: hypothetical protein VEX88_07250 [Glaciibacter sp.]|nr:hypothetical protein [Glaciibacter sp.]